jgi:putative spermidine/putrescine transport system permease protein
MIRYSFYQQTSTGDLAASATLANYVRLASVDLYRTVVMTTLRVSAWTTFIAMLLAYPLALVMVRGHPLIGRALTVIVLAPLLINVVVRTYAWRVILANGENGVLNWTLAHVGLGPVQLLYTEWAVIIGSVHVFLPMMVLPLSAALGKINPAVEEAARTLGASSFSVFRRVTLPLSVPGLAVGATLVFSLTASSFVTPALLGGNFAKMLGTLVEEQILTVFDWPFGAAIATLLTVIVMIVNLGSVWLVERRFPSRASEATDERGRLGQRRGAALFADGGDHAVPAGAAAVPIALSFSDTPFVVFPPQGFTLQWYWKVINEPDFTTPFMFSVQLGVLSAICALILGTPTAIGPGALQLPGRAWCRGWCSRRSCFPMLVTGIALLRLFTSVNSHSSLTNLVIGHTLVTSVCDPHRLGEPAADRSEHRGRGAHARRQPRADLLAHHAAADRAGLFAGGIFAFVTSFDNYAISMWLADAENFPMPMAMFALISRMFDPASRRSPR